MTRKTKILKKSQKSTRKQTLLVKIPENHGRWKILQKESKKVKKIANA